MHTFQPMSLNAAKFLHRLQRAQRQKAGRPREEVEEEEGWESEMAQKNHLGLKVWGLRSHFNFLVAVIMGFVVILVVSLTTNNSQWLEDKKAVAKEKCDFFSGRWVYDNSTLYPLYSERRCKFMSDQTACEKFGRTDLKYQNWRWQPHGCDLPRFNATRLLERLRGKRMAFVGDSLNRNQWISMICLLGASIPDPDKTMETNGSLMSFKVKEYNASIDFYWAPLLVESNSDDPVQHRIADRIVRVQSIQKHARHWTDADILVFNSYLWWRRSTMKVLWGSLEDKDGIYMDIEAERGYELALKTWSEWLEFHVDHQRTQLFFVSLSPTHQRGEQWGKARGQNCYNETEPFIEGHRGRENESNITRIVEATIEGLKDRGVNVQMIDITQLSEYRKDAHPSIYRKHWEPLSQEHLEEPTSYADCIHWCLPGLPDVWNELLYAFIFF